MAPRYEEKQIDLREKRKQLVNAVGHAEDAYEKNRKLPVADREIHGHQETEYVYPD